ncbi:SH3 domain-containing protein [Agaribacter marinus]|uniref:SH3b domain-containing protein n=1 Tax=Agaribacter marinus TaxID=1431249 RepID=A0AA37WIQ4_9ALTE|nr:SH3 domain-containing protein [Agaribacter marinus]GLR71327.1 hypothetical protein GCM10007852_22350 [Agaribacter marinus]
MFKHIVLFFLMVLSAKILSADELRVTVTSQFTNVHSGPADEYPVFYVISKGEEIDILKERTDWYKIRTVGVKAKQIEGWIYRDALTATVLKNGVGLKAPTGSFEDYQSRDIELTFMGGVLDNTAALSATGSWIWTRNIAVDANYTQALGDFSDNKLWSIRMRHTVFPAWKVSPYLALGTGEIRTKPKASLVQSGDDVRKSSHYEVGLGVRYYLTDGVLVNAEYRSVLALTDRDEQERIDQWLIGASVFF